MISRSLETLSIRMQRSADSGHKVAQWIAGNSYISAKIMHPDFITDEAYQTVYNASVQGQAQHSLLQSMFPNLTPFD